MLIRLVSLILYVKGRWVDETGCLRAIGFLNQYNKVMLGYIWKNVQFYHATELIDYQRCVVHAVTQLVMIK